MQNGRGGKSFFLFFLPTHSLPGIEIFTPTLVIFHFFFLLFHLAGRPLKEAKDEKVQVATSSSFLISHSSVRERVNRNARNFFVLMPGAGRNQRSCEPSLLTLLLCMFNERRNLVPRPESSFFLPRCRLCVALRKKGKKTSRK